VKGQGVAVRCDRGLWALALLLAVPWAPVALARNALDFATLASGGYPAPIDLSAYAAPANAAPPANRFEGTLELHYPGPLPHAVVIADPAVVAAADLAAADTWPEDFAYQFVQSGNTLIPVRRGTIPGRHAWWEVILEPGRVWDEPGDHGYTRAAIPFSLQEKNANCMHNGVLMFLFRSDGKTSRTAMQVSSETCHYLQLDLWGLLATQYRPQAVPGRSQVIAAHRALQAARMPRGTLAQLQARYPALDAAALAIGAADARTLHGLVIDGINYMSTCATRHGDYPYCDQLDLPSYSVAKSAFAALALMRLEALAPGSATQAIAKHVPECDLPAWAGVSFVQALDMATGNFDSAGFEADEDATKSDGLFLPLDHAHKIAFACRAYPHAAAPGTLWVYHSADTYLLGTALAHYLRTLPGRQDNDLYTDLVVADLYAPLHTSPTSRVTRRTYDATAQPFTGWGLAFQADDIAKLGTFLARDHGRLGNRQLLDARLLAAALQQEPLQRGLQVASLPALRYQHGFWARNLRNELRCGHDSWLPFMSGYGGISVVLFPNGAVYYNFADDGQAASFDWARPALEVGKLVDLCR
jgi:hypothetical protein